MSQTEPEDQILSKKATLHATYFVYFNFRSDVPQWRHTSKEDLNNILQQYDKDGSVAPTTNWPFSEPSGYVWLSRLSAEPGTEHSVINQFHSTAKRVAMEADLVVDGPHCNCGWRECDY